MEFDRSIGIQREIRSPETMSVSDDDESMGLCFRRPGSWLSSPIVSFSGFCDNESVRVSAIENSLEAR